MATNRRIESPGVQISEIDLSLRPVQTTTTTIFIPGFASKGPLNDPIPLASLSEFEQIYGQPTNGAERYFYHTVKAAFQSPANIMVSRLPYGDTTALTASDQVGLLAYPAVAIDVTDTTTPRVSTTGNFLSASNVVYGIGSPVHYTLSKRDFLKLQNGSLFAYSSACGPVDGTMNTIGNAALIVANQSQSTINGLYEGLYIAIADNTNLNPTLDYNTVTSIKTLRNSLSGVTPANMLSVPATRYGFVLSATSGGVDGSLSEVLEEGIPNFDLFTDRAFDDTLVLGVFKLRQSVFSQTSIQLAFSLEEGYIGSTDSHRQINSSDGGPATSFFIESAINQSSANIVVKVNPYLSRLVTGTTYLGPTGVPQVKIRTLNPTLTSSALFSSSVAAATLSANQTNIIGFSGYGAINTAAGSIGTTDFLAPLGAFYTSDAAGKYVGNVDTKLNTVFDTLLNTDVYNLNIACEAGLGTVYACANATDNPYIGIFDDYRFTDVSSLTSYNGVAPTSNTLTQKYQAVVNTFQTFIENAARRDLIGIVDPLMPILIQANSVKTLQNLDATFTQNVLWPLKNLYAPYNTSYLASYPTAVQVTDVITGNPIWVPPSGYIAANFANTDSQFQPWYAPAGFTRGVVSQVSDIAYYPRQKQRDQLYKSNFNPVAFFPSDGFVIYGQKTMLKRPSAFDRVNVRRLFLALEIATRDTLKYFVFEPNTLYTRTQVINTLTPIFENAKNTQGIYDYLIICDERNNTPTTIDDNTLIIDIYIKPVRTAEFILCNFYATRTGVNFQEIVS